MSGSDVKKVRKSRQRKPSAKSLRELSEIDFSKVKARRNRYAAQIAKEGIVVQVGRGRPTKTFEVGGTQPRSVRFPDVVWKRIEKVAKAKGLTLHAALREAVLAWLKKVD